MTRIRGVWLAASLSLAACDGRPRAPLQSGGQERRTGPAVAVFDLSDGVPEQGVSGWLGLSARGTSLEDLVQEAEHIDRDKNVRGVLVRLGSARIGLARAEEVAGILAVLGAKRPVWCHADEYGNATISLAARGCTRVWVSPATSVDSVGLAAQTMYFHKLLADELGVDVDFLQVGRFKGAEEPFTRDGPSAEARQSLESTLGSLRQTWLEGIRKGRPGPAEEAVEDGPYGATEAKSHGLVDAVGYFDEARDALEKASEAVRAEVVFGAGSRSGPGDDVAEVLRVVAGESTGTAPVMIVRAIGAISMEGGVGFSGSTGIVEPRLQATLNRLERDDDVKAVVLRIDSPGGSALASDLLWHGLMRLRAKKPVVVSIGDMAASGGYYLASAGSVIFADQASIVGSIGVVGGKIAAGHALEKIGLHAETFPAKIGDPQAAARAAYDSVLVPWDEATRDRVRSTMTEIYQLFLSRVSAGRTIPVERISDSAEGRIFSGRDGKDRGLVDEIGGLRDAIARARKVSGLSAEARVGVAGEPTGLFGTLVDEESSSSLRAEAMVHLERKAPEIASFVAAIVPLAQRESVICALPFALTVR